MAVADEVFAIRNSVAVSRPDHVRFVRVTGPGAAAALDAIMPAELYVRDGQILQSLLLDESGRVVADAYVGCDDDAFFLLVDGLTARELADYLDRHLPPDSGVEVEDRSETHGLIGIDGPYAWELLALLAGPDVFGLPYLTFFHLDRWTCFRAGKTGEYGYGLLAPREDRDELHARLLELGRPLDARPAGIDAFDECALENWFFNPRREGRENLTPVELQLQWRVSYRKRFVGSDALRAHREEPARRRTACLVSEQALATGDSVSWNGATVGRVLNAGASSTRGDWVALTLMDAGYAHPGIAGFRVENDRGSATARSETPPLINNRSLHVSPQIHSYGERGEFQFPPLRRR
ncbi:MAG TPA: hypothetical protein VLT84_07350 [Acidobacteriota bacterium]|nr:hypothetical protein [Acidobacteriota bacterium]